MDDILGSLTLTAAKRDASSVSLLSTIADHRNDSGDGYSPSGRARGPPCKVCGDEASGVHYGVDSCEGCKGFFRRCFMQATINFRCSGYEQCDITAYTRNSCQFCRLKKCYAVGMSRQASRLGRRPKRRKETMTANESTTLQQQQFDLNTQRHLANHLLTNSALHHDITGLAQLQALVKSLSSLGGGTGLALQHDDNMTPCGRQVNEINKEHEDVPMAASMSPSNRYNATLHEVQNDSNSAIISIDDVIAPVSDVIIDDLLSAFELSASLRDQVTCACRTLSSDDARDVILVMRSVIDAHVSTCLYTADKVAIGLIKYEANNAGKPTGWDVDQIRASIDSSDPSRWWQHFVDNMAPVIKRVVAFCRKLPGFCELAQDDQITLIKQGSFEVILARYTTLFTDSGMFVPDMSIRIPRALIKLMPMGDFFEEQFKFADIFNLLRLNDAEVGLFTGVLILNPEREGLCDREAVSKLRVLYLQALYSFMKASRTDSYNEQFVRTLSTIPMINRINAIHTEKLSSVRMSSSDLHFPELHREVYPR